MPTVPAWPFLVANHEPLRVDYRPLVAPDFLCEQQRSPVLTLLPLPEESTATVFACMLAYRLGSASLQLLALFQVRDRFDPTLSDRQVRVISGLILPPTANMQSVSTETLQTAYGLYERCYQEFCASTSPSTFPVVASWPQALTSEPGAPLTYLPPCDATRVQSQSHTIHQAPRPASEVHPITSREILRELQTETPLSRVLHFFRVR